MTLMVTRPSRYPRRRDDDRELRYAPVDIEETEAAYLVDLDLPGVGSDELQIEVRDGEIRIAGIVRARERTGVVRHRARRTGEFEYLIALPGDIKVDAVEANLDGGVLSVVAPKASGQQARRITVQAKSQTQREPAQQESAQQESAGQESAGQESAGQESAGQELAQQESTQQTSPQQQERADTPAAHAKRMREGQSRPGPASQQVGSSGTGSTGQVGRSSMT